EEMLPPADRQPARAGRQRFGRRAVDGIDEGLAQGRDDSHLQFHWRENLRRLRPGGSHREFQDQRGGGEPFLIFDERDRRIRVLRGGQHYPALEGGRSERFLHHLRVGPFGDRCYRLPERRRVVRRPSASLRLQPLHHVFRQFHLGLLPRRRG